MKNKTLKEIVTSRILVLDGATGTMIQRYKLEEKDYRGERFANYHLPLKGNNDLLTLTQPQIIAEIHEKYLEAGADIIETNSFNAQAISLADYEMENLAYEINFEAARIAKHAATKFSTPEKPRFVAGSIGPSNKSLTLPPNPDKTDERSCDFSTMVNAYQIQVEGLMDGGADILLVETIFDTLNAKACLSAIQNIFDKRNCELPVMISVTISDKSARTLSGQTIAAFVNSVSHFPYFSLGLNCALGAESIKPYLTELSYLSDAFVSVYPNAGLPDEYGNYLETPAEMAAIVKTFADDELVNIIGGCCGTTPEHVTLFAKIAAEAKPKQIQKSKQQLTLCGTDILKIGKETNFINIGERTNVAGSAKFARLIREAKYEEALEVAAQQIENGANIIDISFDDGLLNAREEMQNFLRMLAAEPEIARVPIMIDSSDFAVIETGLQNFQGRAIVNSISLKNGEDEFREQAKKIHSYGAAMVVMAFDENGQATDYESKIKICQRAYDILTEELNIPACDIIFDCNILTIGTGLSEHAEYAHDFIRAVKWIKQNLPGVSTSGGVSNLSFAFRGNNYIRESLHSVFLYHAIGAGLDMGIVNAGNLPIYDEIEPELRNLCENLIFNRDVDATSKILAFAIKDNEKEIIVADSQSFKKLSVEERLQNALIRGNATDVDSDIADALLKYPDPVQIIEGPLMKAMSHIGELFGEGRMFLPQVLKSARVMKKMTAIIQPEIDKLSMKGAAKSGKIVIATVKGDVHDIGKNIAAVVLACNNFEVEDLGIMVNKTRIVDEAVAGNADIIGLSGLISPSLYEMEQVASEMEKRKLNIPLLISGATTSAKHTAVKIAPLYSGPVVYVADASKAASVCSALLDKSKNENFITDLRQQQEKLRFEFFKAQASKTEITLSEARANKFEWNTASVDINTPTFISQQILIKPEISELIPFINYSSFFARWKIAGKYPDIFSHPEKGDEAKKLYDDAQQLLENICKESLLTAKAVVTILPATAENETVFVYAENEKYEFHFPRNLQKQKDAKNLCLADFIAPNAAGVIDYIGFFALSAGLGSAVLASEFRAQSNDYLAVMTEFLAESLTEAFAEYVHQKIRKDIWAFAADENLSINEIFTGKYRGIRPAPGYPVCPDHSQKAKIFEILNAQKNTGITLSENFAMLPSASVCGYVFAHPESKFWGGQ
ncbi:MAG: methionine synthase [Bacteroidales bacterium]|nr:methionine synthase [Bacteroidales bacterium]